MKDLKNYHYILDGSPKDLIAIGIFAEVSGCEYDIHSLLDFIVYGDNFLSIEMSLPQSHLIAYKYREDTTPITLEELIELFNEIRK